MRQIFCIYSMRSFFTFIAVLLLAQGASAQDIEFKPYQYEVIPSSAKSKPDVSKSFENAVPYQFKVESAKASIETLQADDSVLPELIPSDPPENSEPVDLEADSLTHDQERNVVTASGNVMMEQEGRILRADEITYFVDEDRVEARGNVVLNEPNGDIHLAQYVELEDEFKDGFVEALHTTMSDGSRLDARKGTREGGTVMALESATYSPCKTCENDPDDRPLWALKASDVEYDTEAHRISYKHSRFELWGVPVFYWPYFSHSDGTVDQKSGLLTPSFSYKSSLGFAVDQTYYWAISPSEDATIGARFMSKETPLATAEYRKRWDTASLELSGSFTQSDRRDNIGGNLILQEDENRGHIFGEARWDMNEKWRSGANIAYATDDQFLRQYDFTSDNILENEIYAERFSGRNYAVGRLLKFQDVRVRDITDVQEDQPEVLPEIYASFLGEPGSVPLIGGRWQLEGSTLGLRRTGEAQDMNRASVNASWERKLVSDYGLVNTLNASIRGDYYNVRDRGAAFNEDTVNDTRLFPQFNWQAGYPLINKIGSGAVVIEPTASITAAPNLNDNNDIPNEDSQDVQIDAANIFDPNRFPGLDAVEDQSRVTYGLRTGYYGELGSSFTTFIGQSRRFDDKQNPFPNGSGLSQKVSDFVGEVTGSYLDKIETNYRFQLNGDNLNSQRHEFDGRFRYGGFNYSTNYLFAKALEGTDITESREQITNRASYLFTPEWRVSLAMKHDLGEDPGLRKADAGLEYLGQCLYWSLRAERNLTDDASGESDTELFFRMGLKNVSGF